MIIAEMRPAHVPMKILGFEIQGKNVSQQRVERIGYFFDLALCKTVGVVGFGGLRFRACVCGHSQSPRAESLDSQFYSPRGWMPKAWESFAGASSTRD